MCTWRSCSVTQGNSWTNVMGHYMIGRDLSLTSTPLSIKKHLNPLTPAATSGFRSAFIPVSVDLLGQSRTRLTWFPGITPPQNPTSAQHWPRAVCRLISRFCKVVVGGIEFNGISTTVVIPPATAARVPVQKPSHSVRPGSFR